MSIKMRKIYAIGESLLDIIFKGNQPQTAKPGGSMLNSVVSVGRIGLPVYFISDYGIDETGNLVDSFLSANGVNTVFVNRYKNGNTSLALAFLDEKNDAHYTFYKNRPSGEKNIAFPDLDKDDIILFGSYYSIWPEIRKSFKQFIEVSRKRGALVIYDPNFRKSHASELPDLKPLIIENMRMADIVRGSNEDFKNIFNAGTPDKAFEEIKDFCGVMVYTANTEGVFVRAPSFNGSFKVRRIDPVSTIGAGDNFNAGMITSLFLQGIKTTRIPDLNRGEWEKIISTAVDFATDVCLGYDNYISTGFAEEFKRKNATW
jgi:fructokinase